VLVPVGLNFLMWDVSAVNVWFKLFPDSHKISGDCSTEIQHKRIVACLVIHVSYAYF
jgi:hypothetical protein